MVFAKALCVVPLLYAAIFGQTQSLKNDSYSEKRSVILQAVPQGQQAEVSRKANDLQQLAKRAFSLAAGGKSNAQLGSKYLAENYRGFLLYLLREVWRAGGPFEIRFASEHVKRSGLYFLFWSAQEDANVVEKQNEIYPLYVGMTRRPFLERMGEHLQEGVAHKIETGQWPTSGNIKNLARIVVYVVTMPLPVAMFFESMFLQSFNFPMNSEENGKERSGITSPNNQSVEDGYVRLKDVFDKLREEIEIQEKEAFSDQAMMKGASFVKHFQFGGIQ